jgi:hypothetical protein
MRTSLAGEAFSDHFVWQKDRKREFLDQKRTIRPIFLHPTRLKCGPFLSLGGQAQSGWPDVDHDHQAQRYSPLTQISVQTVSRLAPVWTYPLTHEPKTSGVSRTATSRSMQNSFSH